MYPASASCSALSREKQAVLLSLVPFTLSTPDLSLLLSPLFLFSLSLLPSFSLPYLLFSPLFSPCCLLQCSLCCSFRCLLCCPRPLFYRLVLSNLLLRLLLVLLFTVRVSVSRRCPVLSSVFFFLCLLCLLHHSLRLPFHCPLCITPFVLFTHFYVCCFLYCARSYLC